MRVRTGRFRSDAGFRPVVTNGDFHSIYSAPMLGAHQVREGDIVYGYVNENGNEGDSGQSVPVTD
jgi:hypothetical protein